MTAAFNEGKKKKKKAKTEHPNELIYLHCMLSTVTGKTLPSDVLDGVPDLVNCVLYRCKLVVHILHLPLAK